MLYYSEEFHLANVYYNLADAQKVIDEDLMGFDYIEVREVKGLP